MESKLYSLLYRILKDRLWVSVDGLSFFIKEPTLDLLEESYHVYQKSYQNAYADNCLTDHELVNFLVEQDIWNPLDDRKIDELKKELEEAKISAYENFFKAKELRNFKFKIKRLSKELSNLLGKKHSMDHLSCSGVAEQSRFNWIISRSCFHSDNRPVNWSDFSLSTFINYYRENIIDHSDIRTIARNDPWKTMWGVFKKGGDLFGEPTINLSQNRQNLCSYSVMYDSVYENPESPNEKIIEDDDCLDGWFISQRRKHEKSKKEKESEDFIRNPKIKNSKEVFLMAGSNQEAQEIYGLNSGLSRSILQQRQQTIQEKGKVSDLDFTDVQTDLQMQQNQAFISKMRGK
jgi:hypothetical protein